MVEAEDYYGEIRKMLQGQIQEEKNKREINKEHILELFERILIKKGF